MADRVRSKAKPALLIWARESAKYTLEVAAEKAHVKREALEAWEAGEGAPSIPQLRKLAEVYKRPLVVFFLPKPPKDFEALRDFRRLPAGASTESPELASETRWAHEMRDVALETCRVLGEDVVEFDVAIGLGDAIQPPNDYARRSGLIQMMCSGRAIGTKRIAFVGKRSRTMVSSAFRLPA
jgi:transcriptional regulator with XRE-family HTH domain